MSKCRCDGLVHVSEIMSATKCRPAMKTLVLRAPEASEAEIQAALMRGLQRAGWLVMRVNSGVHKTARGGFFRAYFVAGLADKNGRPACSGFPDVLALRDGVALLLEVKKRGGKASAAQERFRRFAALHGVAVETVEGWAGMEKIVATASTRSDISLSSAK
jgi:hypothetical protein